MVFKKLTLGDFCTILVFTGTSADSEVKSEDKEESEDEEEEKEMPQPDDDTTLFVKNLNFITTDDSLKQVGILSLD